MDRLNKLDSRDKQKIEDLWLNFWHSDHTFSSLQPVEQWAMVFVEYFKRKEIREKTKSTP